MENKPFKKPLDLHRFGDKLLYLSILVDKLRIEMLRLETGGTYEAFKESTFALLEKIKEEVKHIEHDPADPRL